MGFIIRDAKKSDVKSILKLIKELAIFEREPNEVIFCLLYTSDAADD